MTMMTKTRYCSLIALIAALLALSIQLSSAQTTQTWGYSASAQDWGGTCENGTIQSPINIDTEGLEESSTGAETSVTYSTSTDLSTERRADSVQQIKLPGTSEVDITINGTQYRALNMHWHTPTEHTLNGQAGAAELHIVHNDTENKPAVISIVYQLGDEEDPLLQLFLDYVPPVVPQGEQADGVTFGPVDLNELILDLLTDGEEGSTGNFWTYTGSLTTPPCTEGVKWLVSTRPAEITEDQVLALQTANGNNQTLATNSRPLQATSPSQQIQSAG